MSSLRDLLDFATEADLPPVTAFGQGGIMFSFRGVQCAQGNGGDNYESQRLCWCVPPLGACKLRIEIWGGGGMGSGLQCQSLGVAGYSGEYNSRILCASDLTLDNFDNQCYLMCVGMANCCANCVGGCMGCKSYVAGPGLDNFCAEGGYGGKASGICCGFNNPAYGCTTNIGNNCCSNCGCTPAYCCWHESVNAPFNEAARKAKEEEGTCYTGITASYIQSDCCCRNQAGRKWYNPMPGGLMGKFGTYAVYGSHCTECTGTCWTCTEPERANNSGGIFPGLGSSTCMWGGPPGMGGGTGNLGCCYTCYCGGTGATGAIRFTLYPSSGA
jgi:hypothetical protein